MSLTAMLATNTISHGCSLTIFDLSRADFDLFPGKEEKHMPDILRPPYWAKEYTLRSADTRIAVAVYTNEPPRDPEPEEPDEVDEPHEDERARWGPFTTDQLEWGDQKFDERRER